VAVKLRDAADQVIRRERVIIEAAGQPGFSFDKLKAARAREGEIH
jgi:hypothetical protein